MKIHVKKSGNIDMLKHRSFFLKHEKKLLLRVFQKNNIVLLTFLKGILLFWKNIENKYVVLTVTITFSCVFSAFKTRKNTNTFDLQ